MWTRIEELPSSARLGGSAAQPDLPVPVLCYSMDVNALNYCRFSLFPSRALNEDGEDRALVALPNLIDSSVVCISSQVGVYVLLGCRQIYGSCLHAIGFMRLLDWTGRSLHSCLSLASV